MGALFHIAPERDWDAAQSAGAYRGDTLESEGFIHCSTADQIYAVANRRYKGRKDLVLLVINDKKVEPEIRYESAERNERYPHIYGPLNVDAVIHVREFQPGKDGNFSAP